MANFQAIKGWKRSRKRENKNNHFISFLPDAQQKIPKKQPKKKNLINTVVLHFKPKLVGKSREREKIKIIVPFRSFPTRNRNFKKNCKKIRKYHYDNISSQNTLEKDLKGRK